MQRVKVRYLGPDEIRVMRDARTGDFYTFRVGEVVECPPKLAEEVMQMNSRGCTLETARAYDCHLFEVVEDAAAGGEDQWR